VYWVKEMEREGFDMQRVTQDWGSMTEPMRLVGQDLRAKLINYNQHEIDKFCLENTAMLIDGKDHIMPGKVDGKDDMKIDGAVTMIISYRVYIDNRSDFLALSDRRDAYGAVGSAPMEQTAES
jgi:phage terminase large subunit-like protein